MRTRLLIGTVGVSMAAFGALRFAQLDLDDIVDALLWLTGGVIVHDAVVAPLTIAVAVLATRVVPRAVWGVVLAGLVVLATVTATAIPVLGGWGARPDNPTLLDRDYPLGWAAFAGLVLLGMIVGVGVRVGAGGRRARGRAEGGG